jgi:hypothetical protein
MRLDQIAVRLRARSPYEAIDLGFAMVRVWARHIFPAWASVFIVAVVIINLLSFGHPVLAAIIVWWLKPAFDRIVLHSLAGATFGAPPTMRETWRALPSLWWGNSLFASLTWRRLSPWRSFNLAVTQLERQRGAPARARREALGREGSGPATVLTFVAMHFEMLLWSSLVLLIFLFMPADTRVPTLDELLLGEEVTYQTYAQYSLYYVAVLILEPFFVAAGFALYLHARTALEGWDIEQTFRLMDARLNTEASAKERHRAWAAPTNGTNDMRDTSTTRDATSAVLSGITSVAALSLVAAILLSSVSDANAETAKAETLPIASSITATENKSEAPLIDPAEVRAQPDSMPITPETGAKEAVEKVLEDPIFGEVRESWRIKYIGPGSDKEDKEPEVRETSKWLKSFGQFFAHVIRFLAWLALAVVVCIFLYYLVKYLNDQNWRGLSGGGKHDHDMLFGLDVRPESLPESVPDAARAALARGDTRTALSLLYRGALVWLIRDGRIEVAKGDTEGVCVNHVARHYGGRDAPKPAYFQSLVREWQRIAYARQTPSDATVEALIRAWSQHFELATVPASDASNAPQGAPA